MGCSLASSLVDRIKKMKRAHDPDYLFVEPSEMVVTQELKDVAAMGLRDVTYRVGPLITLVDGPNFPFMWAERQKLMLGQIDGADIVALSRTDRVDEAAVNGIRRDLHPYCNGIESLSVHDPDSVENILRQIAES